MDTKEVLIAAKEFLQDENHWLRDGSYYNSCGTMACAVGALMVVQNVKGSYALHGELYILHNAYVRWFRKIHKDEISYVDNITWWNDKKATHKQLMEVYDIAIEMASQ